MTFQARTSDHRITAPDLSSRHGTSRHDVSRPRLTLWPAQRQGGFGGAWWPRTRKASTELGALVAALEPVIGQVSRLSLSVTQWDSLPSRLRVRDRDVRLIWFAYRDPHTVIVGHDIEETTLLLVSTHTQQAEAELAMGLAQKVH